MDPGASLLVQLERGLAGDGHAVSRKDRSMEWWSGPLRQTITASKPYDSMGIPVTSVHIQTDLFKGPPPTEEIAKELVELSHTGDSSAIFFDEESGLYKLGARLTLHEENFPWMHVFISRTAFIQNSTALRMAYAFGAPKGLSVAESPSPKGLSQDKYGGNLKDFTGAVRSAGSSPAHQWQGKELAFIKTILSDVAEFDSGLDEKKQICATLKNNGRTIKVVADADTKHPFWGNGLTLLLALPDKKEVEIGYREILSLNKNHCAPLDPRNATGFWLFADGDLSHFLFLPNTFHMPGLAHIVFMEKWGLAQSF